MENGFNDLTAMLAIKAGGGTGSNGKSAYQIWLDAGNTGSEADFLESLKGKDGTDGANGTDGIDGKDYVLTAADKAEIAEMVEGATVVQAPKYVRSVDEMTDTSRVYVMASTGRIWAYMDSDTEKEVEVREDIIGTPDNPYEVGRLSSSGGVTTDVTTHIVSPYIDIRQEKYAGKNIELHLEGLQYFGNDIQFTQTALFAPDKSVVTGRGYSSMTVNGYWNIITAEVVVNSETSTTIKMTPPVKYGVAEIGYLRMSAKGAEADSHIYITYKETQTVTGGQWIDTGTSYSPALTDAEKTALAEEAASLIDTQLLSVIGSGEVSV